MVFVLLLTTGWTVAQGDSQPGARAAALTAWEQGSIAGRPLPDPDASARALTGFFGSLDAGQQKRLADRYPLVVGNLDGAPVPLRYRANRAALADAREAERARTHSPQLTEQGRQTAGRRMHRFESILSGDRQILAFDPTGNGRAAEVFGDLSRAERVSVVVPGIDTELLTFERTQRPHSAPVGMARALQDQQRERYPGVRTATVAWADYTAPRGLGLDAASAKLAQDGAERLIDFVRDALPRHSGGLPEVALFCHSYGSVACGLAAEGLPPRVTDIAVAGSPGMRADNVGELHTEARVWAIRDDDDWIADVPHLEFGGLGHGADPVAPEFGARRLSAEGVSGHAGYFVPGTTSLAGFASVGAVGTGGSAAAG
ncbi:alpha/beta hydrolase family protein [Streptomyces sp. N2-109]|uniref:Alpha/beta hydrolase family protein n=1 Tax=Streptomyces gossypii TaxID=2883101 RepID=A0ABT2JSC0_9ACTN|nr:alpha/beta hydrolase family protein [Streptomyces gossypii]MCT2590260.1 alpha/beta hydrolase family protein [Streptomyces gossypii]